MSQPSLLPFLSCGSSCHCTYWLSAGLFGVRDIFKTPTLALIRWVCNTGIMLHVRRTLKFQIACSYFESNKITKKAIKTWYPSEQIAHHHQPVFLTEMMMFLKSVLLATRSTIREWLGLVPRLGRDSLLWLGCFTGEALLDAHLVEALCVCVCASMRARVFIFVCLSQSVWVCVPVSVSVSVSVSVYLCLHVCVYVYVTGSHIFSLV